ncbi:MAG: 4Fe-4S binding protein, partial [Paludibacteraceae bacterium]|nr:4Fe-4S binding protein [Paludibacteraceae bacterium]
MFPSINWNKCTHCGECIPVCPENIFFFDYDGLM